MGFGISFGDKIPIIGDVESITSSTWCRDGIICNTANATAHLRFYGTANTEVILNGTIPLIGLVTDWSEGDNASSAIYANTKYAIHSPIYAEATTEIILNSIDTNLDKVEGGGLDIYDADCNLVQENATSIQVLADLYVDDQSCDGTGVRIGDEPPNVACSMTGVAT